MPRARKHLLCLSETAYYHVTSRCVRRAFLCGHDHYSGKSYEHRRSWLEDRVRVLSSLFSIDLCAYAVMSNHYHLVVKLNPDEPAGWSDGDVLNRWTSIYRGPLLVQRYRAGDALTALEQETLESMVAVYRSRLGSLSWFMKCLNEPIARRANAEDGCTGHFWEARFHSEPLRSEQAVLAAMAYVDLNPVRAGIAKTPEHSDFTSVKARIMGEYQQHTLRGSVARMLSRQELRHFDTPIRPLMSFYAPDTKGNVLPIREPDYLALLDATGRVAARGERGRIKSDLEPILVRLGLTAEQWIDCSTAFRKVHRGGNLRLKQPA